jgi:hypothetical protein
MNGFTTVAQADAWLRSMTQDNEAGAQLIQKIWRAMITSPMPWTISEIAARSGTHEAIVGTYLRCLITFNQAVAHGPAPSYRRGFFRRLNPFWKPPEQRYRIDANRDIDAGAEYSGRIGGGPVIANDAGDPFEAKRS